MAPLFFNRLRTLTQLRGDELDALAGILSGPRVVPADRLLLGEGDQPQRLHVLVGGWAARVKWLPDGRRHLATLLVPGDLCDIDGLHVGAYDYGVIALGRCAILTAERDKVLALCDRHPAIARALAWLGFVDNSLLNEAATSLARRSSRERLAHLLCELRYRLAAVGLAYPDGYDLPISQEKIADALGLTPVHVNRSFRTLREDGLVGVAVRRVVATDWEGLERLAGFSPAYLHLDGMRKVNA